MLEDFKNLWKQTKEAARESVPPARRRQLTKVGVGVGVAVVAVSFLVGLTIYTTNWESRFSQFVSSGIPYPAAYVNGQAISYHDFVTRALALKASAHYQVASDSMVPPTGAELDQEAMNQLIQESLIAQYAATHNITVSQTELDQALNSAYQDQGGKSKALQQEYAQYGYSQSDYTEVIRRSLLGQKVSAALAGDPALSLAARQTAEQVLQKLQNGGNIDTLAATYSQDPTAHRSGQDALVAARDLPYSVAVALGSVKDGQVVGDPIPSNGGFYVVKRVSTSGADVYARVIFITSSSLNQWLLDQYAKASIVKLIPLT